MLNHGESPNTVVDYCLQGGWAAGAVPPNVEAHAFCEQWRNTLLTARRSWEEAGTTRSQQDGV